MIYALDTNIVSFILREDKNVIRRLRAAEKNGDEVIIPLMVFYEIRRGLISAKATVKAAAFERICKKVSKPNMTFADAEAAAHIYADLKKRGCLIPDDDLLIGAVCLANNYTLVTDNLKHFNYINELNYTNWVE